MGCWRRIPLIAVLPVLVSAQNVVLNRTLCPNYQSGCCEKVSNEAFSSCMEYNVFPTLSNERACAVWGDIINVDCQARCGNCTKLGESLTAQCIFMLQSLGNSQLVARYCQQTQEAFVNARCPAACETTKKDCQTAEKKACEVECGNYQNCYCQQPRGTLEFDMLSGRVCEGRTIKLDTPGQCNSIPQHCSHHWTANNCSKYKWCTLDLCVVKKVVCETTNQCENIAFCNPSTGLCSFSKQPDGYPCDDELYYTHNDQCLNGVCTGVVDLCKKYNVTCLRGGQCTDAAGACLPNIGRCVYNPKSDGAPCDDRRKYTLDDKCLGGVCQGREVDLCQDIEMVGGCIPQSPCHKKPHCDPKVGECVPQFVPNVPITNCDDNDPSTVNDHCIDGVCVGERFHAGKFQMLGEGLCVDMQDRSMAQYFGDVVDELECQTTCARDPQCVAYAYSFPVCRVYGTVRLSAPNPKWGYLTGHDPPPLAVEKSSGKKPGTRAFICNLKAMTGNSLLETSSVLVKTDHVFNPYAMSGLMIIIGLLFFAKPIHKRLNQKEFEPTESICKRVSYLKTGDDWSRNSTVMQAWPPEKRKAGVDGQGALAGLGKKTVMMIQDVKDSDAELPAHEGADKVQLLPGQVPDESGPAISSSSQ